MTKREKKDLRATRQLCLASLYEAIENRFDPDSIRTLMDVYERLGWIEGVAER